jgi:hypothetical protein
VTSEEIRARGMARADKIREMLAQGMLAKQVASLLGLKDTKNLAAIQRRHPPGQSLLALRPDNPPRPVLGNIPYAMSNQTKASLRVNPENPRVAQCFRSGRNRITKEMAAANANLRRQIELAKFEMPTAPLYRPGPDKDAG